MPRPVLALVSQLADHQTIHFPTGFDADIARLRRLSNNQLDESRKALTAAIYDAYK